LPNQTGIFIDGSDNNIIGGNIAGEGNIISGNSSSGVNVQGSNNIIQGNYIGTDISGTLAIPNGANGIQIGNPVITYTQNQIGGDVAGQGNLISGNLDGGIRLYDSDSTSIFGNTIGLNAAKTAAIPNNSGITVNSCTNTVIGAASSGASNIIANNDENGIEIEYTSVKIEANSIYNNADLGIDIIAKDGQAGVTRNDFSEADDVQKFPGLTNVSLLSAGSVLLEGQMTTTPSEDLTLYFYGNDLCNPSGYGEGELFLGYITKTADASGKIHFSETLTLPSPKTYFTATAWGETYGNSEFSPCWGEGTYLPLISDVYLPVIMK